MGETGRNAAIGPSGAGVRRVVVWVDSVGKKRLIRGTSAAYLCQVLKNCKFTKGRQLFEKRGNTPATLVAIAEEVKARGITGFARHWAQSVSPDRCRCGGPGLYIVRATTYCQRCRPNAERRLKANVARRDPGSVELSEMIEGQLHERDRARKHHLARGRLHG